MSISTINSTQKTVRGFALYVGLEDTDLVAGDPQIEHLVNELRKRLTEIDPSAKTYAAVALAPTNVQGRNLDIVRTALGDPEANKQKNSGQHQRKTGITIDFTRKEILVDGFNTRVSYKEFILLQFLVLREGLTVTRDEIAKHLSSYGSDIKQEGSRAIDVQIRRLRAKLLEYDQIIRTVHGEGYRFDRHADVRIIHGNAPSPDRV